jgi:hypothetical protein
MSPPQPPFDSAKLPKESIVVLRYEKKTNAEIDSKLRKAEQKNSRF